MSPVTRFSYSTGSSEDMGSGWSTGFSDSTMVQRFHIRFYGFLWLHGVRWLHGVGWLHGVQWRYGVWWLHGIQQLYGVRWLYGASGSMGWGPVVPSGPIATIWHSSYAGHKGFVGHHHHQENHRKPIFRPEAWWRFGLFTNLFLLYFDFHYNMPIQNCHIEAAIALGEHFTVWKNLFDAFCGHAPHWMLKQPDPSGCPTNWSLFLFAFGMQMVLCEITSLVHTELQYTAK